jgi:hypothetical protein
MGLRRTKRTFAAVAVAALLGSATYALTASNTFASATNQAGQGAQTISGFAVSNVSYTLNGSNPENYSAVEFDLDGAAGDVRAKVTAAGATYSTCANTLANHWNCPITDSVASADQLTVIAVQ